MKVRISRGLRGAVAVAVLVLSLLASHPANAAGLTEQAASNAPNMWVNCTNANGDCRGIVRWSGNTLGTSPYIYVQNLTCSPCSSSDGFLSEETWLADTTNAANPSWVEIGYYTGYPSAVGSLAYFYARQIPTDPQPYQETYVASVPPPDLGGYTGFKITRNRQAPNQVLLGIWSANNWTNWSGIVTTPQGDSTNGTWAGNAEDIGSELEGYGQYNVSSNGSIYWKNNLWQHGDAAYYGQYVYQNTNPTPIIQNGYHHPSWAELPSQSTTGGKLANWCCQ